MASGFTQPDGGATLTAEAVSSFLIEPLKAAAVVLAARPRIFYSRGGVPLRVPRLDSIDIVDPWRSENELIGESDPEFGEVVLLPSTLKSLKVLHRLSNELVRHSVVSTQTVADAIAAEVARAADKAMLVGTGADNTIVGIANSSGVQVLPVGGTVTIDHLHDAEGALMAADASSATAAWFMHPRSLTALRKQREGAGTGSYLLQPSPTEAGRMTLLGLPVFTSTGIEVDGGAGNDESRIVLADMQQIAVGIDQNPTVTILNETYGNFDQIAVRVVARVDVAPLNAQGVIILEGVTA